MSATEDQFPLTCSWCSSAPATRLIVIDWRFRDGTQRLQNMICEGCAHRTTVLPPEVIGWWLFELVPDDPFRCNETRPAGSRRRARAARNLTGAL